MKRQSIFLTVFNTEKILFILICITSAFASFTKCDAQAIVGKWKIITQKTCYTDEFAKKQGYKQCREDKAAENIFTAIIEYKSDHTYLSTTSISANNTTLSGTWSLSGDKLNLLVDPKYKARGGVESQNETILINGKTMVVKENMPPNKMVTSVEKTFTKM